MKQENDKIHIGLFIDTFYPMMDGVIQVVDNYARRLQKFADVTVFTISPRDKKYKDDFPYKVVRCSKLEVPGLDYDLGMPTLDNKFMTELKKSKLDIVHIHSPFSIGKVGVQYAKRHKIPCVATNHSQFEQDFYKATKSKPLTQMLLSSIMSVFNKCDENWAVNEGVADLFVSRYKLKAPVKPQYNATNHKPVKNVKKSCSSVNKKFNLKDDDLLLCFVGRISVLKNILFIAEALNLLKQKGLQFKMIFVGTGTDEKLLKNKVKELGLTDNVIFAGKITNQNALQNIYCRSKLLLFPSKYDTDGLVKYEAACQKTPTVSIKGLYCSSNIIDNQNGFLSDDNIESFAQKIYDVCNDDNLYKTVAQNTFDNLYITWDNIVKKAYVDYLELIKANKIKLHSKKYPKTVKQIKKSKQSQNKLAKKDKSKQNIKVPKKQKEQKIQKKLKVDKIKK